MPSRVFPFSSRFFPPLSRFLALVLALGAAGCAEKIGDKCVLSTDCSTQGDRQCDTSMPNGYCTIFNCGPNSCPDYAACYLFHPEVPGCGYNDRDPSRTSQSFCMEGCSNDGDCRSGYVCVDARKPPWNAILLDDNQNQPVCMPNPDTAFGNQYADEVEDAAVCQSSSTVDAAFPALPDAGVVSPVDAGVDATLGAGTSGDAASE